MCIDVISQRIAEDPQFVSLAGKTRLDLSNKYYSMERVVHKRLLSSPHDDAISPPPLLRPISLNSPNSPNSPNETQLTYHPDITAQKDQSQSQSLDQPMQELSPISQVFYPHQLHTHGSLHSSSPPSPPTLQVDALSALTALPVLSTLSYPNPASLSLQSSMDTDSETENIQLQSPLTNNPNHPDNPIRAPQEVPADPDGSQQLNQLFRHQLQKHLDLTEKFQKMKSACKKLSNDNSKLKRLGVVLRDQNKILIERSQAQKREILTLKNTLSDITNYVGHIKQILPQPSVTSHVTAAPEASVHMPVRSQVPQNTHSPTQNTLKTCTSTRITPRELTT